MKRSIIWWVAIGVICLTAFSRCNISDINFDDIEVPNHKGEFGIALGPAKYTMQDLIEELQDSSLVIEEGSNNLIKVIYRDTSIFDNVDEIVIIDDVSNPGSIQPGFDISNSPIDQEINHVENLQFTYPIADDEELDSIIYNTGSITLDIQSTFNVNVDYEFVIDDIVDRSTEQPIVFSGSLNNTGSNSQTFSLVNHRTVAERVGSDNIFTGTFNGTLFVRTGDTVTPDQSLDYSITIENVGFQTIYGYFGEKTFDIQNQSIDIKFFEGIDVGGFTFNDPELKLTIDNYIGVIMGLGLENITSSNEQGLTQPLTGSVTESLQFIRAPGVNSVGNSQTSVVSINNSNSNIRDLLNISPNLITIDVTATSNFNVEDPEESRNFVTEDGKADIFIDLEMPLDVKLVGFTRDFNFEMDSIDVSETDTVRLLVRSINYMPFTGDVDLQLIDASETILYEFPDVLLIQSPELPQSGKAEEPMETVAEVKLFDESLDAFLRTTKLNLFMTVDSYQASEDKYVKIFSDYELELKVAIDANLNKEL